MMSERILFLVLRVKFLVLETSLQFQCEHRAIEVLESVSNSNIFS